MIKKSIIVFVAVFALYNLLLHWLSPETFIPQNIKQDNVIKVQEYIYSDLPKEKVILGSSLAAKLDKDMLAKSGFFNLAFRGQSVYDGLKIINKSNVTPKIVFIEINVLTRHPSITLEDVWFEPAVVQVKKALPALKERNQPVNNLLLAIQIFLKSLREENNSVTIAEDEEKINKPKESQSQIAFENSYINKRIAEYQNLPNDSSMKILIASLKQDILNLESKGVKIVFFEMPMHPKICESPRLNAIREIIRLNFPREKYAYYPPVDCQAYKTRDGIHLTSESVPLYTKFFISQSEEYK